MGFQIPEYVTVGDFDIAPLQVEHFIGRYTAKDGTIVTRDFLSSGARDAWLRIMERMGRTA